MDDKSSLRLPETVRLAKYIEAAKRECMAFATEKAMQWEIELLNPQSFDETIKVALVLYGSGEPRRFSAHVNPKQYDAIEAMKTKKRKRKPAKKKSRKKEGSR